MTPARQKVVDYVTPLAGCGVAVPGRYQEYVDACLPLDTEATQQYEAPRRSLCGELSKQALRVAGVVDPLLSFSFAQRFGRSLPDIQRLARSRNAWVNFGEGRGTPMPGDVQIVNDDPVGAFDRGHARVIIEYVCLDGVTARQDSIDGGQISKIHGGNSIEACRQYLRQDSRGRVWCYRDEACTVIDRRVYGWLDLDAALAWQARS
jgi:hypothetical protein